MLCKNIELSQVSNNSRNVVGVINPFIVGANLGGQSIYCHQAQHIKRPGKSDSHLQGKRFLKQFFQKQGAYVENEVYYSDL